MKNQKVEQLFQLPARELKTLSFSKADRLSVEHWVKNLPMADMGKSTRYLYLAIKEVCELDTSPAVRMELAEALRPAIHYTCAGLRKNYLNQQVILPEQPRKIANLSQALQTHLATAYLITACQCSEKMGSLLKKPTALMGQAIYHALIEFTDILVRNYLLYRPMQNGFWKNIHRLYQLARHYKLNALPQVDKEHDEQPSSIDHAYLHLLLWGCIKANQLRQDDIGKLEGHLWEWARHVRLAELDRHQESAFVVDPEMDTPPVYQKFYRGRYHPACQSLNTDELIKKLKELSAPLLQKKSGLTQNLINHLILAWGVFTGRTFMRLEANSRLLLCVGLSTTHFYLSERQPFADFVFGDSQQPKTGAGAARFTEQKRRSEKLDVWDESIYGTTDKSEAQITMESIDYHIRSGGNSMMTMTGSDAEKYQNFEVDVVNMSPGGYCLEWHEEAPAAIKAGELIGVREQHHNSWNIGVIRWVRQSKEKSLQIGVELLSPSAEPYGARISDHEGNPQSDFMRVLMLPEIKTAGQASTLLTPAVSFKPGHYALLARDGREIGVRLGKLMASSGSYFQFAYEPVESLAPAGASGKMAGADGEKDTDIDSVWDLL
ncbi:MAG TPA: hypothetical protein VIN71_12915 [Pseudomonadales bacterium]